MDCVICMKFVEDDIYSTFCGHLFCKKCLDQMIASSQTCWTCKTPLVANKVHKIYLPSSSHRTDLSLIKDNMMKLMKNDEEIIKRVKALEEAKKPDKGNVILIIDD